MPVQSRRATNWGCGNSSTAAGVAAAVPADQERPAHPTPGSRLPIIAAAAGPLPSRRPCSLPHREYDFCIEVVKVTAGALLVGMENHTMATLRRREWESRARWTGFASRPSQPRIEASERARARIGWGCGNRHGALWDGSQTDTIVRCSCQVSRRTLIVIWWTCVTMTTFDVAVGGGETSYCNQVTWLECRR